MIARVPGRKGPIQRAIYSAPALGMEASDTYHGRVDAREAGGIADRVLVWNSDTTPARSASANTKTLYAVTAVTPEQCESISITTPGHPRLSSILNTRPSPREN